ncbi:MAG: hypothetical protein AB7S75_05640 [Desulfococcaceae bacterium]
MNFNGKGQKKNIAKSYITDESGKIKSVILDYQLYQKIEELLPDEGLLKAMEEVQDEETVEYEEVRDLISQL